MLLDFVCSTFVGVRAVVLQLRVTCLYFSTKAQMDTDSYGGHLSRMLVWHGNSTHLNNHNCGMRIRIDW
eukprot:3680084-Amphidinium_carterae.1